METRHFMAVAVGSVAILGAAGCSTPEPALGGTTATVTIDGNDTGGAHPVRCHQSGWSWYIETPEEQNGFTAVLETDGPASPRTVDFRDFGGFTGTYWADNIGEAEVTGANGKYTITGTADGNFTDDPGDAAVAQFRIETDC